MESGSSPYLPALRPDPEAVAVTRRIARLGTVLGLSSLLLVIGGAAGWAIIGEQLAKGSDGRGPWPLVLAGALVMGVIGIGCALIALALGNNSRRQALGALCVSLVAPLAVGILALALFFASTNLSWNF